ncbi:hypothetical protein [Bacillus sp. UNC125MFCrub1.1]|uniref:hypothetical protein n=1 Tax=Bacillus sp. UNC125MFCrub1.1 TaxID=1380371 RepID=UPI000554D346|nr:hypothetical protein [Bacillus sp. UNC125MFCrub1.1]
MNEEINGCIKFIEDGYLTKETSDRVRELLGIENSDDLTELTDYILVRDPYTIPFGATSALANYRLVAKSSDSTPQEIPLLPDEEGVFFFRYVGGDRP